MTVSIDEARNILTHHLGLPSGETLHENLTSIVPSDHQDAAILNFSKDTQHHRIREDNKDDGDAPKYGMAPATVDVDIASWMRFSVRHYDREQISIAKKGNRKFNQLGAVFVQVFTGQNIGLGYGDKIARSVADIFDAQDIRDGRPLAQRGNEVTRIIFGAANVRENPPDGKWNMHLVEIPFHYVTTG